MKKIVIGLFIIVLLLSGCSDKQSDVPEDANPHIASIYNMAVEQDIVDQTYEEWLESVSGEDGREVTLRVEEGMLQWSYLGETPWFDLFNLDLLQGPKGDDGASAYDLYMIYNPGYSGTEEEWLSAYNDLIEMNASYDENMLEIMTTLDEILDNVSVSGNDNVLTDEEINFHLSNLEEHINLLIPSDIAEYYNDSLSVNECVTEDYDICFSEENYPSVYGDEFLDFDKKMNTLKRIAFYNKVITDAVGNYDSTPIVPGRYIDNQYGMVNVDGKNETSVLISGNIDSSLIPIPYGVTFELNFELLIYEDADNEEIIVESNIGASTLGYTATSFKITSKYDLEGNLIDAIYTTKVLEFKEWKTLVIPEDENSITIIASNGQDIEYFDIDNGTLTIMHSNDWSIENPLYTFGVYNYEGMIYEYDSEVDEYLLALNQLDGWTSVDYLADEPMFSANEYKILLNLNDETSLEYISTDEDLEDIWITKRDVLEFYLEEEKYKDQGNSNILLLITSDHVLIDDFFDGKVTYSNLISESHINTVYNQVDSFTYNELILLDEENIESLLGYFYLD